MLCKKAMFNEDDLCLVSSYQSTDASGKNVPKTVILSEEDEKWNELRHKHIAEWWARFLQVF